MTQEGKHIHGSFWLSYDYDRDNTEEKLTALMDEFFDYINDFAEKRDANIPSIMGLEDIHGNVLWSDGYEDDYDPEDDDEYVYDEDELEF